MFALAPAACLKLEPELALFTVTPHAPSSPTLTDEVLLPSHPSSEQGSALDPAGHCLELPWWILPREGSRETPAGRGYLLAHQ